MLDDNSLGTNPVANTSTVVANPPDDLPAPLPEQSLAVPPVADILPVPQDLVAPKDTDEGKATPNTKPHNRIREKTLEKIKGMTIEECWEAIQQARASYDQEIGVTKDTTIGKLIIPAAFERERRRLYQILGKTFIDSVMDTTGAAKVLENAIVMQEVGRDEVFRRMVIAEAGQRIETETTDKLEAAYQKQHLVRAIYDQAKTVSVGNGGVTEGWAGRAVRGELRKTVLSLLSNPELTGLAEATAKEWISTAKESSELSDVQKAVVGEKVELGKAILRIKDEGKKGRVAEPVRMSSEEVSPPIVAQPVESVTMESVTPVIESEKEEEPIVETVVQASVVEPSVSSEPVVAESVEDKKEDVTVESVSPVQEEVVTPPIQTPITPPELEIPEVKPEPMVTQEESVDTQTISALTPPVQPESVSDNPAIVNEEPVVNPDLGKPPKVGFGRRFMDSVFGKH